MKTFEERYNKEDWQEEVRSDNTVLGYEEWFEHKQEEEDYDATEITFTIKLKVNLNSDPGETLQHRLVELIAEACDDNTLIEETDIEILDPPFVTWKSVSWENRDSTIYPS